MHTARFRIDPHRELKDATIVPAPGWVRRSGGEATEAPHRAGLPNVLRGNREGYLPTVKSAYIPAW